MKLNSILVVDDSSVDLELVSIACSTLNCEVDSVKNPTEALKKYDAERHSIVLTDYMMDPIDGVELVAEIKKINPSAVCLIMSGYPDAKALKAVEEMGLTSMITKPIRLSNLTEQLRLAFHKHRGATQQLGEVAMMNRMDACIALLGRSPEITLIRKQVGKSIKEQDSLFLEGPYGVGKPDIIKFIHESGIYAGSQMVVCPCDKMTLEELREGLITEAGKLGTFIQKADKGTLVLNHIESIPMELQVALGKNIKAIAEQCRIISWTNVYLMSCWMKVRSIWSSILS